MGLVRPMSNTLCVRPMGNSQTNGQHFFGKLVCCPLVSPTVSITVLAVAFMLNYQFFVKLETMVRFGHFFLVYFSLNICAQFELSTNSIGLSNLDKSLSIAWLYKNVGWKAATSTVIEISSFTQSDKPNWGKKFVIGCIIPPSFQSERKYNKGSEVSQLIN